MTETPTPAGADAARLDVRVAGYCVVCNRIVVRAEDGSCPSGHDATVVQGRLVLADDEQVPHLPRFNLAAFLVPPVWGPGHGQWAGAVFLPMWLFMDSVVASAEGRGGLAVGAAAVVAITFGMQAWFASRANGLAWRRIADRVSVEEYLRRERIWLAVCVPLAVLIYGWGLYYRLVIAG